MLDDVEESKHGEEVNPDRMTYEQLLELSEKVGKVSKGFPDAKIQKIGSKSW
jgi:hypothetical protein